MFNSNDMNDFAKGFEKMVDGVMTRSIGDLIGSDFVQTTPSANVKNNEKEYLIELAAPGLRKKDFDIKIIDDKLEIKVNKEAGSDNQGGKFTRREFNYISFLRKFKIPKGTDRLKISAVYEMGILFVSLPKLDASESGKFHTIKVS